MSKRKWTRMKLCTYCEENETEFECPSCGEPTCEDCFEEITQFNAGNPSRCLACVDDSERERAEYMKREEEREKAEQEKKRIRNEKARKRYWLPENVQKRRQKRIECNRNRAKETARSLAEAFGIVSNIMGDKQ